MESVVRGYRVQPLAEILAGEFRDRTYRADLATLVGDRGFEEVERWVEELTQAELGVTPSGALFAKKSFGAVFGIVLESGEPGHVVNTASIAGLAPVPGGGNGAYTASKHAVVGLSETLVEELVAIGADVGVTVLCPGPVPSRIHTADRNRPPDLVAPGADRGSLPDFQLALEPVDATTVAEQVCAAIEADRRYLLPGPGTPEMARRRIDRVLADLG